MTRDRDHHTSAFEIEIGKSRCEICCANGTRCLLDQEALNVVDQRFSGCGTTNCCPQDKMLGGSSSTQLPSLIVKPSLRAQVGFSCKG